MELLSPSPVPFSRNKQCPEMWKKRRQKCIWHQHQHQSHRRLPRKSTRPDTKQNKNRHANVTPPQIKRGQPEQTPRCKTIETFLLFDLAVLGSDRKAQNISPTSMSHPNHKNPTTASTDTEHQIVRFETPSKQAPKKQGTHVRHTRTCHAVAYKHSTPVQ